jgi:hypothetical protein
MCSYSSHQHNTMHIWNSRFSAPNPCNSAALAASCRNPTLLADWWKATALENQSATRACNCPSVLLEPALLAYPQVLLFDDASK